MKKPDIRLIKKQYKIIYADPPWEYRNKKTGGSMKSGACQKYSTLSFNKLKRFPIGDIADKNSVLFLWATVPLLPDCIELMQFWGYKYKTALFWRKIMSLGMGFWYRGQVEILLMGIKGKIKAFRIQKSNFIQAKCYKHSQKPDEFYERIENSKLNPKIELFARRKRDGWDVWGNEVNNDIEIDFN